MLLASFLPVSGDLGTQAALALRDALLPIAYLLALAGFLWQVSRNGENWQAHFEQIILTALLVLTLANWTGITKTVGQVSQSITQVARDRMETRQQVRLLSVLATATINAPKGSVLGNFDPWALVDALSYQGVQLVQRIAVLAQVFLNWIQQFALNGLFAISPLLLGFLMLPWTRQIATNFIMATISVALWDIGFALVDVLVFQIQDALLDLLRSGGVLIPPPNQLAAGAAIIAGPGRWGIFFAGYGAIVLFNILLYFVSPIMVGFMMRGANPAAGAAVLLKQAAQAGRTAFAAASSALGAARAAEAIAAQIQAAQATTQAGAAHAEAMSTFQQGISSGQGGIPSMPFSPGGGGGSYVPPPPGEVGAPPSVGASSPSGAASSNAGSQASVGQSYSSGGMSAVQVDSSHFVVTDSEGKSSSHQGNAGDSQVRAAAFTMHQNAPPLPITQEI